MYTDVDSKHAFCQVVQAPTPTVSYAGFASNQPKYSMRWLTAYSLNSYSLLVS